MIAEAARIALGKIGRASTIPQIYSKIIELKLYKFNTDVPEHVLRTEVRRKSEGVERIDASAEVWFYRAGDEVYGLMKETSKRKSAVGLKRIQRAADKAKIIEQLTSDQVGVFREIWRVLLFAAAIGFKHNRRDPITTVDPGKGIDQSSFGNNPVWPGVAYLLSLVHTGGTEGLLAAEESEGQRIAIFEEFANGGLAILNEHFQISGCNMDSMLNFIQNELAEVEQAKPDLQISI